MKLDDLKRPLDIEYVDFRIQSINKGGFAVLLAYKNARVDMERLDEVCGPENWQRDHKEYKGNIYCGIGIKCNDEWVWKWDAGAESFSDKEKGEASDSFKRAGFNWGIGRELYNYPFIQIKLHSDEFKVEGDRAKQTWKLKLKEWDWVMRFDHNVKQLVGIDQNGRIRFIHASDIKELENIWSLFPDKHSDESFKNYIKELKAQLS